MISFFLRTTKAKLGRNNSLLSHLSLNEIIGYHDHIETPDEDEQSFPDSLKKISGSLFTYENSILSHIQDPTSNHPNNNHLLHFYYAAQNICEPTIIEVIETKFNKSEKWSSYEEAENRYDRFIFPFGVLIASFDFYDHMRDIFQDHEHDFINPITLDQAFIDANLHMIFDKGLSNHQLIEAAAIIQHMLNAPLKQEAEAAKFEIKLDLARENNQ